MRRFQERPVRGGFGRNTHCAYGWMAVALTVLALMMPVARQASAQIGSCEHDLVINIRPPEEGGNCIVSPWGLSGVLPGEKIMFANHTEAKVTIIAQDGLFDKDQATTIKLAPQAAQCREILNSATEGGDGYWIDVSCVVGEARPRIVIKASTSGGN